MRDKNGEKLMPLWKAKTLGVGCIVVAAWNRREVVALLRENTGAGEPELTRMGNCTIRARTPKIVI